MLTDSKVHAAKKRDKSYRLTDGQGLFLHVATTGIKTWRVRYYFNRKESQIVIGHYPDVSLSEARLLLNDVKKNIREGKNPQTEKLLKKEASLEDLNNSFEEVARNWFKMKKPIWSERHAKDVIRSLECDIFPALGGIALQELTPKSILRILQRVEARGAIETAHRLKQRVSEIFSYAIGNDLCNENPVTHLSSALKPVLKNRQPAIINLEEAIFMIKKVENVPAYPITKLALRFLLLTLVRPGELRLARWEEIERIDTDNPLWRIPNFRMKMKRDHVVPLCPMAVEILKVTYSLSGHLEHIFPNSRFARKPMSENALGYLINRAGYYQKHVPHGFRAMFSSIMNEHFPHDRAVIDLVLAHSPKNQVEGAYNRTTHFERRKELMKEWQKLVAVELKPVKELLGSIQSK